MAVSSQSLVLDTLVRMVVPMRREFGLSLDVQTFMRDSAYASEVLARALRSQVERLRTYAEQVDKQMRGTAPRPGIAAPAQPPAALPAASLQRSFDLQRRTAVKLLFDQVGPNAEPLAVRMESAANLAALRPLLGRAGLMIDQLRGTRAAHAYLVATEAAPGEPPTA